MSPISLVSRQALRLGIILLLCAGITVVTSTFLQTPMGTAALSTLVRRGGPPEGVQGAPNAAAGPQRVRGAPPQAGDAAVQNAGPREGGGRQAPNLRAGLPEVLRSAGIIGLFTLVVAVLLRFRKPRPRRAPAHIARARRPAPEIARAA
jgi:hypothetical protein